MIAPNGDYPASPRSAPQARALSIAHPVQDTTMLSGELLSEISTDIDLTLIYALTGGTVMLLVSALVWTLLT